MVFFCKDLLDPTLSNECTESILHSAPYNRRTSTELHPRCLDRIQRRVSYSLLLLLLIGLHIFSLEPVNLSVRHAAMGTMLALVIVELDPLCDPGASLRSGVPSMQVDAFVFSGYARAARQRHCPGSALCNP